MNESSPIDWSVARHTVQGDEELLRELMATFLDEMPRLREAMQTAIAGQDAKSLQRAAHTLKGALGHFGARRAYDLAMEVETRAKAGDVRGAAEALPALEEATAAVAPVLRDYIDGRGVASGP